MQVSPRRLSLLSQVTLGSDLKDLDNPIVNVAREMCALSKRVEGFSRAGEDRMVRSATQLKGRIVCPTKT